MFTLLRKGDRVITGKSLPNLNIIPMHGLEGMEEASMKHLFETFLWEL